jgi:hypothetical protein
VTSGVTDWKTPAAVVKYFKTHFPGELLADGSLRTPGGWLAFAKAFDLKIEEIRLKHPLTGALPASPGVKPSRTANDLAFRHFEAKLRTSHVITVIGTADEDGLSHTVVVYGADRTHLCYMNPLSDPKLPLAAPRPPGGSGRVDKNWFCDTYDDFATGPKYLLIWRA